MIVNETDQVTVIYRKHTQRFITNDKVRKG